MTEETKKKQLHQSHLSMLYKCGEQFRRVVIEGDRQPPGIALITGKSVHSVVADNLNYKIESKGSLLSNENIKDLTKDYFENHWNETEVVLDKEDLKTGIKKVKGTALDSTMGLSVLHHNELAPIIQPKEGGIERPWVIKCNNYPFDLAGTIDIDEEYPEGDKIINNLRDTKTRSNVYGRVEVERSDQLTVYAMAKKIIDGKAPDFVYFDYLIKRKRPLALPQISKRTDADFKTFLNRFTRACEVIEKQVFTPANQTDWFCSEKFCGFARANDCPFFSKRPVRIIK